jgi:hypothetical protein
MGRIPQRTESSLSVASNDDTIYRSTGTTNFKVFNDRGEGEREVSSEIGSPTVRRYSDKETSFPMSKFLLRIFLHFLRGI